MNKPYDPSDYASVLEYAQRLQGHTLRDFMTADDLENEYRGKGRRGQLLEKGYFGYEPNNESEPDFKEIGLELKSCPLKKLTSKQTYKAKEDLVLAMIDYMLIVHERFETSAFFRKNRKLLLMFYLHEEKRKAEDLLFPLVTDYQISERDMPIIKDDWLTIMKKVQLGKAHELSAGDTHYLAAKTKAADSRVVREQPNSPIPAKPRAFAYKASFVNVIIERREKSFGKKLRTLIQEADLARGIGIEKKVSMLLEPFLGKSIPDLLSDLHLDIAQTAKAKKHLIVRAMLGLNEKGEELEEFKASSLHLKTMQLNANNKPTEHLSFPAFKFEELAKEEDWETSQIHEYLQRRYLFTFFKETSKGSVFHSFRIWTMSYEDRTAYREVWKQTKEVLNSGRIVLNTGRSGRMSNCFPKGAEHRIGHVRPHAGNKYDTYPLPVKDAKTGMQAFTKQSFWLNSAYIKERIVDEH